MSSDHDIIRQLFSEKLVGMISYEDDVLLQQLIDKTADNRAFYESLLKEREALGVDTFVENLDTEKKLIEVKKSINSRKKIRYNWMYAAAAIIIFLGFGVRYWLQKAEQESVLTEQVFALNNHNEVKLFVEGGESITLNGNTDSIINIGDLKLNASENAIKSIEGTSSSKINTLVVPAKLDYEITLADGTKVFLNSTSTFRFPAKFSGDTREVYLEGEGFFEVAKNKDKPFIVHTKDAAVKVLGTSFNVNTYGADMKTSLVEGSVLLTAKHQQQSLKLTPGIQANYNLNTGFKTHSFDAEEVLSWREGIYYFHNLRIKDLAPLISRWFDMSLDFQSNKYNDLAISGLIEKGQLQAFLKDLEASADINYEVSGKEIRFK